MIKGRINIARFLLSSVLFLFSYSIFAETSHFNRQVLEFIEQQISHSLLPTDRYSVEIHPINAQIQLTDCNQPIQFHSPRQLTSGKFSIKASCSDPKSWSIYIRGAIYIERQVIIATQALPKGMTLTAENVQLQAVPLSRLQSGYFTTYTEIADFVLKRPMKRNELITPQSVTPPLMIKKNDHVTIIAGKPNNFEVRVNGIAMQDGRKNQQISVRNSSSGKVIKARVIDRGLVRTNY